MQRGRIRLSLQAYAAILFLALLIAFAGVSIGFQYQQSRASMLNEARDLFGRIGNEVGTSFQANAARAALAVRLLAQSSLPGAPSLAKRLQRLGMMAEILQAEPQISASYVGYDNGDFFLLRRLSQTSPLWEEIHAPAGAAYLVQSEEHDAVGRRQGRFQFYDAGLRRLADRVAPDYNFDPRSRPWFKEALTSGGLVRTAPYVFFTTKEPGVTVAQRSPDGHAVAGTDVTLAESSGALRRLKPTASAELAIFNQRGEVLSASDPDFQAAVSEGGIPRLLQLDEVGTSILSAAVKAAGGSSGKVVPLEGAGGIWQSVVLSLGQKDAPVSIVIAAPQAELLADAIRLRNRSLLLALVLTLLATPVALWLGRLVARPLDALTCEAREIRALRFAGPVTARSPIREIGDLAEAMEVMKSTIRQLLSVSTALAGERDFDMLLRQVLQETIRLAAGRGGFLYLAEPDGRLKGVLSRWEEGFLDRPPADLDPARDGAHPALRALDEGPLKIPASPQDMERWCQSPPAGRPVALLAVPLRDREQAASGVLLLAQEEDAFAQAEEADVLALVQALSATSAIAIETQRLLREQKVLLQAIIELIAEAIDSKSPYTGAHCRRVPVLAEMLAHAAAESEEAPFKEFRPRESEWEEIHIAAWLHDCGKLTTPEYVVDKATKLETIYDRLHEIRMRFEVIKREAEATCWKAIADGAPREARLAELRVFWATLDEEFAFVCACNEGGESMAPERIDRLRKIAARSWTRTLSDRIGISQEELARKAATAELAPPVWEPLLADKPEHVVKRGERDRLAPDNPWHFAMDVPEHLYNRGELHNLTQPRGTLTPEERFKINAHMIDTIRMLTRLPLPRHLRRVPEIAGGHHERMNGTGYPRRLEGSKMSLPARMLAIADVFEALTAEDRPYKKAKKLSEAIAIMARMRDEDHLDSELFDLFLRAGIPGSYARRHLKPEQIDDFDLAPYLRPKIPPGGLASGSSHT